MTFVFVLDQPSAARVMTFLQFSDHNFEKANVTDFNLYIVSSDQDALYVGIARHGIYNRWFGHSGSHIQASDEGWISKSQVGRAIIKNLPASLNWKIELRSYPAKHLNITEALLIQALHPVFNTTFLPQLTEQEIALYRSLAAPAIVKTLPDESNRGAIEEMLLHAYEFADSVELEVTPAQLHLPQTK